MAKLSPQFGDRVKTWWACRYAQLFSPLSVNVIRECCLCHSGDVQRLLAFQGTRVLWFDPTPGVWKDFCTYTVPRNFEYTALFVSPTQVLVTGRDVLPNVSAFLLSTTGECTPFPSLLTPRRYHGIASDWRLEVVFVFGGVREGNPHPALKLKAAETLNLSENEWKSLEELPNPRSHFNPCSLFQDIYLAGGGSITVDVFNQQSLEYRSTPCELPSDYLQGGTLVFMSRGLLVLLCRTYICSLKVDTLEVVAARTHKPTPVLPRCLPMVRGKVVYTVDWNLVCKGISVDTGEAVSEAPCPTSS